jgi:hypothetical protein
MQERRAIDRLTWLALAAVVVAIFAVGLANGQDDWHDVLVLVGGLLQVVAVLYATRSLWFGPLRALRTNRQLTLGSSGAEEEPGFSLSQEEVLVAGGMMIAGVVLTLAGNLLV